MGQERREETSLGDLRPQDHHYHPCSWKQSSGRNTSRKEPCRTRFGKWQGLSLPLIPLPDSHQIITSTPTPLLPPPSSHTSVPQSLKESCWETRLRSKSVLEAAGPTYPGCHKLFFNGTPACPQNTLGLYGLPHLGNVNKMGTVCVCWFDPNWENASIKLACGAFSWLITDVAQPTIVIPPLVRWYCGV